MNFEISDMRQDEEAFVLASVKRSLLHSDTFAKVPTGSAYAVLNPWWNAIVDRSAVLVARQGRKILGFAIYEVVGDDLELHFQYTRHQYRRLGVARTLLAAVLEDSPSAVGVFYTTPTTRFADVVTRYGLTFREVPK